MTLKTIVLATSLGLLACTNLNSNNVVTHTADNAVPLTLPKTLMFRGQTYTLRYQLLFSAEYYLQDEQDFDWTKLLTVTYSPKNQLADFEQSLRSNFQQQHLAYATTSLKPNYLIWQAVFSPVSGDSRFSSYESNLAYTTVKQCGMVGIIYAEHLKPNGKKTQLNTIYQNLTQQHAIFATQSEQLLKGVTCQ